MTIQTKNTTLGEGTLKPQSFDIVLGRGGLANNHAGNKAFHAIAASYKSLYMVATTNRDRRDVIECAMTQLKDEGYRFVQKVEGLWYPAPPLKVRTKIIQTLRDGCNATTQRQYIQDHDVVLKDSRSATPGTEIYADHVLSLASPSNDLGEVVKLQNLCYQCKFFDKHNETTTTLAAPPPSNFWIRWEMALNHKEWAASSEGTDPLEVKYWKKTDSNGKVIEEVPVVRASAACLAHSLSDDHDVYDDEDVENENPIGEGNVNSLVDNE